MPMPCGVSVIAALHGAVLGGGLALASAANIRVADLIGKARTIVMMLADRVYRGKEAVDLGFAQYLVKSSSFELALEIE